MLLLIVAFQNTIGYIPDVPERIFFDVSVCTMSIQNLL